MKTNKKELTVFALCAYAIPFLMMPLLYICLQNERDTSIFANAQMFYPAAGVMLAFLLAKRPDMPMRFYILHITATALMLTMSVLSAFLPQEGWLNIANFVIIIASVLGWIFLLTEKKTKREDYGLRLHGKFLTAFAICAYFLVVKTGMVFLSVALQGGGAWAEYLTYWQSSAPWLMALVLVPNFFLSFLPFFGEEYGWRYYLTPALQGRFGARRGALAVGVLWGLWHLPLNLFFYSPDTSLQSIVLQLVVCVTLGVFFTFAYEKCGKNIWVPVLLHYLNNNMILVWSGTADISNQIIGWGDVASAAVQYAIVFLPFLAAKCFKKAESKMKVQKQLCTFVFCLRRIAQTSNALCRASRAVSSSCWRISREISRSLVVMSTISIPAPANAASARAATPQLVTISSPKRLILL